MNCIKAILRYLLPMALVSLVASPGYAAGGGELKRHVAGIFLGATRFDDGKETETTASYGVEYEFRFTKHFSFGGVYETSPDAHDDDGIDVQLVGAYYRPDSHWRIGFGYGREKIGGPKPKSKNLRRLGVAYDFHFGDYGIAPTINLDRVNGHNSYVVGVVFVRAF